MSLSFFAKTPSEPIANGAKRARPKIGVALGGGVARGWAHIGALRELIALGVTPDIVAGASIGAVVGGCFAAGRLDTLEAFARSLTKRTVFSLLDISFNGGGLIGGGRLRARLNAAMGPLRIEELPIPFVCVATEIGTGHEIWLKRGALVEAMCASYALPGVFEPVRMGGRWLFDGAIVNPVPVSVARAFGAEIVIALGIVDGSGRGTAIQDLDHTEEEAALPTPAKPPARRVERDRRSVAAVLDQRGIRRPQPCCGHGQHVQHHAGPDHALAPGRGSARRIGDPESGKSRLVRVSSRRRADRDGTRGCAQVER